VRPEIYNSLTLPEPLFILAYFIFSGIIYGGLI